MKWFKKAAASVLSCMLLLTTLVAFGQTQEYYTDDFNQYTADETMPWSGYPTSAGSDVFVKSSGSGGQIYATAGRDGKTVLQLATRTDGNNVGLNTKKLAYSAGNEILFSIDFCVKDWGEHPELLSKGSADKRIRLAMRSDWSGGFLYLSYHTDGADGTGVYFERGDKPLALCKTDEWYRMTVVQTAVERMVVIAEQNGTEVVNETSSVAAKAEEDVATVMMLAFKASDAQTTKAVMQFDNASLARIDTTADTPSCLSATVADDSENVPRNQKLVFTFDQRVSGTPSLWVGDKPVGGTTVAPNGLCGLELRYDGLLEKGTTYTVRFDDVRNGGGLPCDTAAVSFTTEDLHPWNDVEILNVAEGGSGTQVTFSISETYGYQTFSGAALAAVYAEGRMKAVDMVLLNNVSTADPITESFELGGTPAVGETLAVMLFDVGGTPIPLAVGAK